VIILSTRIQLIACGGTISTVAGKDGLPVPEHNGEDLIKSIPGLGEETHIEVENFSKVLSSQLTVEQLYGLGKRIHNIFAAKKDIDGIVVTHGTGAMEESSWMTDLLVDDERPVVFTGAMRSASDPYTDGPFNMYNAIRVAGSRYSRNRGTMVVMNGVIHPARDVMKTHTTGADTFKSGEFGPLGYVYPDRIHFAREHLFRTSIYTDNPQFNVDVVKFVVGMDDRFLQASVDAGAKAIVIEGSGLANLNDQVMKGVDYALSRGVHVVVCSRSSDGRVYPAYGTKTGAQALLERGCLLASMPGPKTRILMMLLLGTTNDRAELQKQLDPEGRR
jgi:L-asparaginase